MSFNLNSKYVEKISEKKKEYGIVYYKVVWKQPEDWIKEEELSDCQNLIEDYKQMELSDQSRALVGNVRELSLATNEENYDYDLLHVKVLKKPSSKEWYTSDDVNKQLKMFNEKCCKTPSSEIKKAKGFHNIVMKQLDMEFQSKKDMELKKLEYTGSSYEGLKIISDGLEFDVMFVMDGKEFDVKPIISKDGYCNLVPKDSSREKYKKYLDCDHLSPNKIKQKFFSIVVSFANSEYPDRIKVIEHGPAIQINVKRNKADKDDWYSVDLVPCYEVKYEDKILRYVPKPLIEPDDTEGLLSNSWRRSFSEEEKTMLKGLDKENECRRQVARIIKGIFRKEPTYTAITSYHVKTVLFHIVDKMKDDRMTWKDKDYPERVFDMLAIIEGYLEKRNLPHFYIPSMNIIGNIKGNTLDNIKNRISCLRSSEKKFMKAIGTT